ncbi:MAG: ABC-F family ATP-binding cassette domain-containing protein [Phycisphaeraceae bacterium]|nr:ABC-F family ATP-binding cassette domain-containing protein [Phycisphaeraceae bacterium]
MVSGSSPGGGIGGLLLTLGWYSVSGGRDYDHPNLAYGHDSGSQRFRIALMALLAVTNLMHSYGDHTILEGVSLSIEAGDRIGIVGRNGAGKSTLLRCITGEIRPDSGTISLQRGARAGYLQQDPRLDPDETLRQSAEGAFKALHDVHKELDRVYEQMGSAEGPALDRLLKQQVALEQQMESLGGYSIGHRIDATLHGLGFTDAQFEIPVKSLSGGQRGRLALARLLLEGPDLLMLDEPTNHLDIDGRMWLERFLREEYKGAVVMISHDRYLLDAVVKRIIEVEDCRLIDYPGNYAAFREIRAQRRLTQLRAYEKQQDRFRKEEEYIRRFKAGQRARQAKGRESRLEREKEDRTLERPMELDSFRLALPRAERTGDVVLSARGLSKSYESSDGSTRHLFTNLDISIARGERWAIVGPNGAGKTTLVRCLLGELEPDAGTRRTGSNVKPGYYRQTHDHMEMDVPVWRFLQNAILKETQGKPWSEQQARDLAGAFLFTGKEQEKELRVLSGGERSRAALAALLASAKNLLVLDEPTNHLDILASERLEEALRKPAEDGDDVGFDGTLVLISHDRALIDATCDHLLILDGSGSAEVFVGSFSEWYSRRLANQRQAQQDAEDRERQRAEQERKRKEAEQRDQARQAASVRAPAPKRGNDSGSAKNRHSWLSVDQLETRMGEIQAKLEDLEMMLADPAVWTDVAKSKSLTEERNRARTELEELEEAWLKKST